MPYGLVAPPLELDEHDCQRAYVHLETCSSRLNHVRQRQANPIVGVGPFRLGYLHCDLVRVWSCGVPCIRHDHNGIKPVTRMTHMCTAALNSGDMRAMTRISTCVRVPQNECTVPRILDCATLHSALHCSQNKHDTVGARG